MFYIRKVRPLLDIEKNVIQVLEAKDKDILAKGQWSAEDFENVGRWIFARAFEENKVGNGESRTSRTRRRGSSSTTTALQRLCMKLNSFTIFTKKTRREFLSRKKFLSFFSW